MKRLDFVVAILALLILAGVSRGAPPVPKPSAWTYEFHSWGGMQTGRGGAFDTGLGAVAAYGRARVGGQMAQNRLGFCGGFRCLGLNFMKDTRVSGLTQGWRPGLYVALSF